MKRALIVAIALAMAGAALSCNAPAQYAAEQSVSESHAEYEQCLATHGQVESECQSSKKQYESRQESYDQSQSTHSAGVRIAPPELGQE
jgi:hypothetical protein